MAPWMSISAIRHRRHSRVVLLLLVAVVHFGAPFISRKAKCSIECYLKCANSGTPLAAYCNCPPSDADSNASCNSITELLLKEKTIERQIESANVYKDLKTILLKTESFPNAFIYIFEFATISAERPTWIFAGASSSPQTTLSIPDGCRDYQFRTVIVLRSTDPHQQIIVFRPKAIPVRPPPFNVPEDSIHLNEPKQLPDGQSMQISVSWRHPQGYDDSDIFGYEAPTAYPIRCQVPEDRLSQPKVQVSEGGGAQMSLTIPLEALQERCRIYLEVRMIPRCVRIDYFDIQIPVELDCQKFPQLEYCKREVVSPGCTEVVDLWGRPDGKATIMWQQPDPKRRPLYYVVNWGTTQTQGTPPLVTRRIVPHAIEVHVPGNKTNVEIVPKPGVSYGVQICAIYSLTAPHSSLQIVPVVPFTCTKCKTPSAEAVMFPENSRHATASTLLPASLAQCLSCNKIVDDAPPKSSSNNKNNDWHYFTNSNKSTTAGDAENNSPSSHSPLKTKPSSAAAEESSLSAGCGDKPGCSFKNEHQSSHVHFIASGVTSLEISNNNGPGAHPQRTLLTHFAPLETTRNGSGSRNGEPQQKTIEGRERGNVVSTNPAYGRSFAHKQQSMSDKPKRYQIFEEHEETTKTITVDRRGENEGAERTLEATTMPMVRISSVVLSTIVPLISANFAASKTKSIVQKLNAAENKNALLETPALDSSGAHQMQRSSLENKLDIADYWRQTTARYLSPTFSELANPNMSSSTTLTTSSTSSKVPLSDATPYPTASALSQFILSAPTKSTIFTTTATTPTKLLQNNNNPTTKSSHGPTDVAVARTDPQQKGWTTAAEGAAMRKYLEQIRDNYSAANKLSPTNAQQQQSADDVEQQQQQQGSREGGGKGEESIEQRQRSNEGEVATTIEHLSKKTAEIAVAAAGVVEDEHSTKPDDEGASVLRYNNQLITSLGTSLETTANLRQLDDEHDRDKAKIKNEEDKNRAPNSSHLQQNAVAVEAESMSKTSSDRVFSASSTTFRNASTKGSHLQTSATTSSSLLRAIEVQIKQKGFLIFIGPIILVLGTIIVLAFVCLAFNHQRRRRDRRRKDHLRNYASSYKYEPTPRGIRGHTTISEPYILGSSALAARTNAAAVAAIGSSGGGSRSALGGGSSSSIFHTIPSPPTSSGSGSDSPSETSTEASSGSRAPMLITQQPAPLTQANTNSSSSNYYSDNTARFLMTPAQQQSSSSQCRNYLTSKNVHF